jgi:23S rRNA (pseudouridine1915-N3)-methyltransferase
MKAALWWVGDTSFSYIKEGQDIYTKRLKHFLPFETQLISRMLRI